MRTQKIKKIVVTGGAGFLGSHLCEKLLEQGHHVICVDNLYTGALANLALLLDHPLFTFMEHDIQKPLALEEVDEIYNLACPASPVHYQRDPFYTMRTCVIGVMEMIALAQKHGAKLLQASTSEVYGDPLIHPQSETYVGHVNPIGIRACYDEGKRAGETLCFDAKRQGLDVKVARIFNTYGPRMQEEDGRVVSNFIVQALRGLPLTIYGQGAQTRSFCYVDDLIRGLILLMESADCGPINLGNPSEMRIIDFATKIIALTGSTSPIVHHPLPADDPKQRCPDISKAKQKLGWEPRVDLDEGLKQTIDYFAHLSCAIE